MIKSSYTLGFQISKRIKKNIVIFKEVAHVQKWDDRLSTLFHRALARFIRMRSIPFIREQKQGYCTFSKAQNDKLHYPVKS
jgi:hypothetical protein